MADNYKTPEELIAMLDNMLRGIRAGEDGYERYSGFAVWGIVAENTRERIARELEDAPTHVLPLSSCRVAAAIVRGEVE